MLGQCHRQRGQHGQHDVVGHGGGRQHARHALAEATKDKVPTTFIAVTKRLVATYGKPQEINADSEFEASKAYQTFLRNQGIQFRGKENINDLAVLDSNMAQLKKNRLPNSCKLKIRRSGRLCSPAR